MKKVETKSSVKQEDVAEILNAMNQAIEGLGYEVTGYDNTGVWLMVMVDRAWNENHK